MKLKKLIVVRQGKDIKVTKVVLTNLNREDSNEKKNSSYSSGDVVIGVDKLVVSLGPSATFRAETTELEELLFNNRNNNDNNNNNVNDNDNDSNDNVNKNNDIIMNNNNNRNVINKNSSSTTLLPLLLLLPQSQ